MHARVRARVGRKTLFFEFKKNPPPKRCLLVSKAHSLSEKSKFPILGEPPALFWRQKHTFRFISLSCENFDFLLQKRCALQKNNQNKKKVYLSTMFLSRKNVISNLVT